MGKYKSMFSPEDLAEMRREFEKFAEENHGKQPDEEPHEKKHGGRSGVAFYNNIAKEMAEVYINDCVDNILHAQKKRRENAISYFYNDEELEAFKEKYTKKGGNLNDLKIGTVDKGDKNKTFLCYEVCQKRDYEAYKRELYGVYKE